MKQSMTKKLLNLLQEDVKLCKYEGYWQMADGSTVAVAGYNQNMASSRETTFYCGEPLSVKDSFPHLDIFYDFTYG